MASQFSSKSWHSRKLRRQRKVTKMIPLRKCDQMSNKLQQWCQMLITFTTSTDFLFLSYFYVFLKIELRTLNMNILIADIVIEAQWPEYQIGHDLKQVKTSTYLVTPGCLSMTLSLSLACLPCTKYTKAWMFNEWLILANKAHCVHTTFLVILIEKLLEDTNNTNSEDMWRSKFHTMSLFLNNLVETALFLNLSFGDTGKV